MDTHIDRVLIGRDRIAERVREMADELAADLRKAERADAEQREPQVTLIAIMTGGLIFLADLIRHMPMMMRIRLVTVSSYPGAATTTQGATLEGRIPDDLSGQHVLIVDDILDSGGTITLARELIGQRGPASIRTCVLLRKQIPAAMEVGADYIGFDIPDEFVVGYGLDYDGFYRNLPDVVTLRPEAMERGER